MEWSVNKCSILKTNGTAPQTTFKRNRQQIKNEMNAEYSGVTATEMGTGHNTGVTRIRKATAILYSLIKGGLHLGAVNMRDLLKNSKTYALPVATFGIHFIPLHDSLRTEWDDMERIMMIEMMGCFSVKTKRRLRAIAGLRKLVQQREMKMASLQKWIVQRAKGTKEGDAAEKNPDRADTAR